MILDHIKSVVAFSPWQVLVLLPVVLFMIKFTIYGYREPDSDHSTDPPTMDSGIPAIGHILGLRKYGVRYFERLRRKNSLSSFVIYIMGRKTYIIASPSLAHLALNTKALSLEPLKAKVAQPLLGVSKAASRLLGRGNNGEWVGSEITDEHRLELIRQLSPGPELSRLSSAAAHQLSTSINACANVASNGEPRDLYLWLRDTITIATTIGLYGPDSPFSRKPSLINDIWTFEEHQLGLILNIFPRLTAQAGLSARERLAAAFKQYFSNTGDHLGASAAVRSMMDIFSRHGFSLEDQARFEIQNVSLAIINTTPTSIWMIFNIFSRVDLLISLRSEIEAITRRESGSRGGKAIIDRARMMDSTSCPLLHATYNEALRLFPMPTCNRVALADIILRDPVTGAEFKVKKGGRVTIPTATLHIQEELWSEEGQSSELNVEDFAPERFLVSTVADDDHKDKGKDRRHRFMPYGSGIHLCPGRSFAKVKILAMTSLIVMALDFVAPDGSPFTLPERSDNGGSLKPAAPVMALLRARVGLEGVEVSIGG